MKKQKSIDHITIRMAPESSIRRLARYCNIEQWDILSVDLLVDKLYWKGVVSIPYRGYY